MKTYEYKGFGHDGRVCKGMVEALSVKNAREKLSAEGVLVERVSPTGRRVRFPSEIRATVYRELAALLRAGLPLVRALDTLIQSPEISVSHSLLAGIRDRVREGMSLADALSAASNSVTSFERAIIESSERSATVESMLERLASFLDEQEKLRGRVQSALIYPSIVLTVGICVAVLMLGLLVPRARDMLIGSKAALPGLTVFMIGFGRFVIRWGAIFLAALIMTVFCFHRRIGRDPDFRVRWDRWLFSIPVFGRGYTILVNLRFSRTLSILLQGAVSVIDAFVLAGRATGSAWVLHLAEREARSVRHGSSLSESIRRIPPLARSLPGWIRIGETSGDLERLLESAEQRYQYHWDTFIAKCLSFLEPLLILLIGGFVLLVTLSVLLPVLSLTKGLS